MKLLGQHRKPYFIIGYVVYCTSAYALYHLGYPTLMQLAVFSFMGSLGQIMADVMGDTMIVSR